MTNLTDIDTVEQLLKYMLLPKDVSQIIDELFENELKAPYRYERMIELCIILGSSIFDNCTLYTGKIGSLKVVENFNTYLRKKINFGNTNGVSDVSFKSHGMYHFSSVKFYNKEKSCSLYDCDDLISCLFIDGKNSEYNNSYKLLFFVKNKKEFMIKVNNSKNRHSNIIKNGIVFGLDDLKDWIYKLKMMCCNNFTKSKLLFYMKKPSLQLKFHQSLIVDDMIIRAVEFKAKKLLVGCVCRTGKSYIIAGFIDKILSTNNNVKNILIFTSRPNETRSQFLDDIFNKYSNFDSVVCCDLKDKDVSTKNKNDSVVHFTSKQYLDKKKFDIKYDLIVIDESHSGGTTLNCKNIINSMLNKDGILVFVSATYRKPKEIYNIEDANSFYWDLNDIEKLKILDLSSLQRFESYRRLYNSKTSRQISNLHETSLIDVYKKFPKIVVMTYEFNTQIQESLNLIKNSFDRKVGFSMKSLFMTRKNKGFLNPQEVTMFVNTISGNGLKSTEKQKSIFSRIKSHSLLNNSRTFQNGFTCSLWFMPYGENMFISDVCESMKKTLMQDRILNKYAVLCMCDIDTNFKETIIKEKNIAINSGKLGLIILTGSKLSLGISLKFVDIVLLLNHFENSDIIYQMMFRSTTEDENKKYAYVVDLNPTRIISSCLEYLPTKSKEKIKKRVTDIVTNILEIDSDLFESKEKSIDKIVSTHLDVWKLRAINFSVCNYIDTKELYVQSNIDSSYCKSLHSKKTFDTTNIKIHKGFDKTITVNILENKTNEESEDSEKIEELTPQEIWCERLNIIIPIICFFSYSKNNLFNASDYINYFGSNQYLIDALLNKLEICFGKKIKYVDIESILKDNIDIIYHCMDTMNTNITTIDDKKELLLYLNSQLLPKNIEKKEYGEVFTPLAFVEKMLDILEKEYPNVFENSDNVWLDPCNGIGNYSICLYYRLYDKLKDKIKNCEERKKHILEKMIWTCEINDSNHIIYCRIMNRERLYSLNSINKDYLSTNIKVDYPKKFDFIIGNPPYQQNAINGKYGSSTPLYQKFIEHASSMSSVVFMVTPSRWFSGGKGLIEFRKRMLNRKDIVRIDHYDNSKDIFKNVEIKGGVSTILIDIKYTGLCKLNSFECDFKKFDIIIESKYHSLIKKIMEHDPISNIFCSRNYFKIETNDKRLCDENTTNHLICYVSKQKKDIKYILKEEFKTIQNKMNKWRVITPRAAHKGKSGFSRKFIAKPNQVHTNSFISFETNTQLEAQNLISYLDCKLPNMLLGIRKITQDISTETVKWIPIVPLHKKWTNCEVELYFKLNSIEKTIINDYCATNKIF